MKLLRYGELGRERPAILDLYGRIRDLGAVLPDLSGDYLGPESFERVSRLDLLSLPLVGSGVRLGPCVAGTRNFIAVGLNYADHATEANMAIPTEPVIFNKATSCICGPNDPVKIPHGASKVDWEVELALVINQRAYDVNEDDALSFIAGYCICNDLSERSWQLERAGQWMKGKSSPGFGPIGPWLVTPDEINEPLDLTLTLDVGDERMQCGSTSTMIFGPAFLISYLSKFMVLEAGDIVTTGTPAGVGMASNRYLKSGDQINVTINGLGEQLTRIL